MVDDDPIFLHLLRVTLSELGYGNVVTATSADYALAHLRTTLAPFDCLLLDIEMPGTDGIELCRLVRMMPAYRTTPILMVTAMSEKMFIDRAFSVGATDYVNKPIEASEVKARLATIEKLLRKTRQADDLVKRLQKSEQATEPRFCFDDLVQLDDVGGLISYLAFENYLLKLGSMKMFVNSAIGFHVANAQNLFANSSRQDFLDIMAVTAECIWRNIRGGIVFTYAGGGDFVAAIRRTAEIERGTLEDNLRVQLEQNELIWEAFGCSVPKVWVGSPVHHTLVGFRSPGKTLSKATALARSRPAGDTLRRYFRMAG